MGHRLGVRVQTGRGVGRHRRVAERALVVAALPKWCASSGCELLDPVGVQLLEDLADAPMQLAAPPQQDRAVGRVLREAVTERVLALGRSERSRRSCPLRSSVRSEVERSSSPETDRRTGSENDRPMTEASCSVCLAPSSRASSRAVNSACSVVGIAMSTGLLEDGGGDLLHEQRVAVGALEDLRPQRPGPRSG